MSRLFWFCIATACDWLRNSTPVFQSIRVNHKTNHDDLFAQIFPHLVPATRICFNLKKKLRDFTVVLVLTLN